MSEPLVRFLSLANVLRIHEDTIRNEGGSLGLRDEGLLASAVDMPQASFSGQYLHSDLAEMAGAYLYHICENHASIDGNKRTAAFSTVLFLALNGISDEALPSGLDLEHVTLRVATGEMSKAAIAEFLREHGVVRSV